MQAKINWLAVVVSAIAAFVFGGLWYSRVLFGNSWMKENYLSSQELANRNKAKVFGWGFILTLVMSVNLAVFLKTPGIDCKLGLLYGLLTGVWVFCGIASLDYLN